MCLSLICLFSLSSTWLVALSLVSETASLLGYFRQIPKVFRNQSAIVPRYPPSLSGHSHVLEEPRLRSLKFYPCSSSPPAPFTITTFTAEIIYPNNFLNGTSHSRQRRSTTLSATIASQISHLISPKSGIPKTNDPTVYQKSHRQTVPPGRYLSHLKRPRARTFSNS